MRGWWQGAKAWGAGPQPVRVCKALLGSCQPEPGNGRGREELECYSGTGRGGWDLGFKLHWAWQEAPPPPPANKAVTPRVELWELESQAPLGGNESGRPGSGAAWQEPSVPRDMAGLRQPGQKLYL